MFDIRAAATDDLAGVQAISKSEMEIEQNRRIQYSRCEEGVGVHWRIDEELAKLGKWQRGRTFAQHEIEAHEDEVLRHDIILRPCISIRTESNAQDYAPR